MANAMSTSKPKAYKRLLFVVLLMPHAPKNQYIYMDSISCGSTKDNTFCPLYTENCYKISLCNGK